jgi:hypothetical protein
MLVTTFLSLMGPHTTVLCATDSHNLEVIEEFKDQVGTCKQLKMDVAPSDWMHPQIRSDKITIWRLVLAGDGRSRKGGGSEGGGKRKRRDNSSGSGQGADVQNGNTGTGKGGSGGGSSSSST